MQTLHIKHGTERKHYNEDIRLINAKKEIPNHDVLCAGFHVSLFNCGCI